MNSTLESLITDRTESDLINDTNRAYIAYSDLRRIESACKILAKYFGVEIEKRSKSWSESDFRTESEMARIRRNLLVLKKAFFVKKSTPAVPEKITYTSIYQANDIEKILKDLGEMHESMVSGERRMSFKLGARMLGNRR